MEFLTDWKTEEREIRIEWDGYLGEDFAAKEGEENYRARRPSCLARIGGLWWPRVLRTIHKICSSWEELLLAD